MKEVFKYCNNNKELQEIAEAIMATQNHSIGRDWNAGKTRKAGRFGDNITIHYKNKKLDFITIKHKDIDTQYFYCVK